MGQPEPIARGYDSPEGPCFGERGELFFVNWLTSSINRLGNDGVAREFVNTAGVPAGLAFHRDGTLYCADEGDNIHGVIKISPAGEITSFVSSFEGHPLNGANDLCFDLRGVLYFSDPWRSSAENPVGGFYRAFPDGRLEQLDRGLAFPNGVALNADETAVFLGETYRNQLHRYELTPDGRVGPREVFTRLSGPAGPDGMAFDAEGNLYVAHFNGGAVEIFDPNGRHLDRILLPGHQVTNVAFGGPEFKTLAITECETASVYQVQLGIAGQPLFGGLHHR